MNMKRLISLLLLCVINVGVSQQTDDLTTFSLSLDSYVGLCDSIAISTDTDGVQLLLKQLVINGDTYCLQHISSDSKPVLLQNIGYWQDIKRSLVLDFNRKTVITESLKLKICAFNGITKQVKIDIYDSDKIVKTQFVTGVSNAR